MNEGGTTRKGPPYGKIFFSDLLVQQIIDLNLQDIASPPNTTVSVVMRLLLKDLASTEV